MRSSSGDTDPTAALTNANSLALSALPNLPPNTLPPVVLPFDPTGTLPLGILTVSNPRLDEARVKDLARIDVRNALGGIRGVVAPVVVGGKDRTVRETILWRDEHTMPQTKLEIGPDGALVPILIRIPPDAKQTDFSNPNNSILWRLDAQASVPGIDFTANYEVPVFKTAAASQAAADDKSVADDSSPKPLEAPSLSGIIVRPSGNLPPSISTALCPQGKRFLTTRSARSRGASG